MTLMVLIFHQIWTYTLIPIPSLIPSDHSHPPTPIHLPLHIYLWVIIYCCLSITFLNQQHYPTAFFTNESHISPKGSPKITFHNSLCYIKLDWKIPTKKTWSLVKNTWTCQMDIGNNRQLIGRPTMHSCWFIQGIHRIQQRTKTFSFQSVGPHWLTFF